MSFELWLACISIGSYFIGSIPFGYLAGRVHGINLFQAGSGNIGATNVGRVLGWKWALTIFILDLLKGALPVYSVQWTPVATNGLAQTLAAVFAFLGHIFPITLRFKGGKGVATGAGTVLVLTHYSGMLALYTWLVVTSASKYVSIGSILAVTVLVGSWLLLCPAPFSTDEIPKTLYVSLGTLLVLLKHRTNIARLLSGSESNLKESLRWHLIQKVLLQLSLGLALGAGIFFNFLVAPSLFRTFPEVVQTSPTYRSAMIDLKNGLDEAQQIKLGNGLAGSAVGPLFDQFFLFQLICVLTALITCYPYQLKLKLHAWIFRLLLLTSILSILSIPLAHYVSQLRIDRYSLDITLATQANKLFGPVHGISLLFSWFTTILIAVAATLLQIANFKSCQSSLSYIESNPARNESS